MPVRFITKSLALAVATLFAVVALWGQAAPKQAWKDRAEYDLYEGATKATDNAKKIELLNTWKQKYPASDFSMERLLLMLETYNAMNQVERVMETGNQILAADPKNLRALYIMTLSTIRNPKPTPDFLASGQKAAAALASGIDEFFGMDKKPAATSEADWKKARTDTLALAQLTQGWVAMQQKNNVEAEKHFTASLQTNPANAQVSYWLAGVILAQKNPDKNTAAIFSFIRAAYLTGPGALPDNTRKDITAYVTKLYNNFHGSAEGLDELRKMAESQALPPNDLTIKSAAEIQNEQEEAIKRANPMMALWKTVKTELTGANGASYFESGVKGALLPGGAQNVTKFKAKLVAAKPPKNPKELVVSVGDSTEAEATLVLDEPLVGSAPVGTDLEFEGVPASFTASPFMLTFEVAPDQLTGWPAPAPPATKKGGAKKAAPPKK